VLPYIAAAQQPNAALAKLFADYYEQSLRDSPERATAQGRAELNDRWTDWSKAAVGRRHDAAVAYLKRLDEFNGAALSRDERLSVRLMRYQIEQRLEAEDLDLYLFRVFQMSGLQSMVYSVVDLMPARNAKDYENIIARLRGVPAYVDQNLAILDEAIRRGLVQPRVVVDRVNDQLATHLSQDAAHSPLLAAFRRFPANIAKSDQDRLREQADATYENQFLPAWRKLATYMKEVYAAKARPVIALTSVSNGKSLYAMQVRHITTTNLKPEEIHQVGLKEVARIESEMQGIMREVGFSGTVDEFDKKLDSTPAMHFQTKDEMLAYCRNIAKVVEPELPRLFKNLPALLYGIRAIPEDREASSASIAQAPAPDGTRPGWFNLNAYQPEKQVRYNKEALVLHEAVPGHILQLSIAQQMKNVPEFRRSIRATAYGEGWGLYAESLGPELGVYRDPYSRYGRLTSERFRAVRLVVDTGIHALGWSRDQAIAYAEKHSPTMSKAEIDRYIGWPGQALAYKIGELKIRDLRAKAEKTLGPKFDVRDFHDVVLRNGSLPLEILEEQVNDYIASANPGRVRLSRDDERRINNLHLEFNGQMAIRTSAHVPKVGAKL
jgi:prolyl oligopeptidase